MNKSTGTADKYVHVSKTAFPELTICPTYPYKLDALQANGIPTRNKLRFGSQWVSNNSRITPRQLYSQIVLQPSDVIQTVELYLEQFIDGKNIIKMAPKDTICNGQPILFKKEYYFVT